MTEVLNMGELPGNESARDFEGYLHGDVPVTFITVNAPPGSGPALHRHPYPEVFVVQDGQATFTVNDATIDASGGQIVIVPANTLHKFVNTGKGQLRQIDIHCSDRFITEWLED